MANNEGIIFINCPNCGELLEINSQQAEEMCPICKSPLDIQTLVVAEPQPTRKDKIKELLGRNLNSYHTKAKQLLTDIEKKNKEQNHKISVLTNKLDNDYLTKTEEGSVISLDYSKEGMVYLDELQGNTMVNYCTDGSKELTLNGDIDVEGTFVTTTEGVENGLVDVICEGNTLINLISKNWSSGTFETKNNRECLKIEKSLVSAQYVTNVKSGSTYTLIYDYISTELINGTTNPFGRLHLTLTNQGVWVYDVPVKNFSSNKTQFTRSISVFTIPADKQFTTLNVSGILRDIDGTVWIDKEILLLEGDWSNKELPPYFEDMKSVGQDDVNGHKIEILSSNGNLCERLEDTHYKIYKDTVSIVEESKNSVIYTTSSWDSGFSYLIGTNGLFKNKRYIISWEKPTNSEGMGVLHSEGLKLLNSDKKQKVIIPFVETTQFVYEFELPNTFEHGDIIELRFKNGAINTTNGVCNVRINEGNTVEPYAESKFNKKEILLNEPLRALPNGVKDRFVKIGGKWFIERNCGKHTFNGMDGSYVLRTDITTDYLIFSMPQISHNTNSNNIGGIICDKFNQKYNMEKNKEFIRFATDVYTCISINPTKLTTQDVEGFKTWLQSNPTTVVYQLATPTYEPIEDVELITYLDTTHISNNSTIPCTMKVKNSGYNAIIKPSTLYTVALDTNKSGTIGMNLGGVKGTTTNNVLKLTTPATLTDDSLRLYGKGIKGSKVRLLEGDKTNWMPSFFEGMKSSFEDKVQSDGTYKMEILSHNKNLIDFEGKITTNGKVSYDVDSKSCNISASSIENGTWQNVGIPIKVCNNKTYVLSYEDITYNSTNGVVVDKNSFVNIYEGKPNRKIGHINYGTKEGVFTIPHEVNVEDLRIRVHITQGTSDSATINIKGLMLTESKEKLEFTSPEYNKIQFSSIEPLRGVDNVKDRFIFKDGKLMIERNCDEVILNGSENWRVSPVFTQLVNNRTIYYDFPTADKFNNNKLNGLCNKFKVVDGNNFVDDTESIVLSTTWWDITKRCSLRVQRSKLSSTNLNSFKEWLSENPIKVVYELAEPIYEEIPYELQKIVLEGYANGTLFLDTNIPPTATITYAGEAPIVSAIKSTRTNVSSNTDDINDNIVPYLMDMDYRVVCLQLADNTESISVARLLGSTYEMLQRDIQSKRYPVDEYKHRLDAYLEVKKITEEEYIKLGEMLNE